MKNGSKMLRAANRLPSQRIWTYFPALLLSIDILYIGILGYGRNESIPAKVFFTFIPVYIMVSLMIKILINHFLDIITNQYGCVKGMKMLTRRDIRALFAKEHFYHISCDCTEYEYERTYISANWILINGKFIARRFIKEWYFSRTMTGTSHREYLHIRYLNGQNIAIDLGLSASYIKKSLIPKVENYHNYLRNVLSGNEKFKKTVFDSEGTMTRKERILAENSYRDKELQKEAIAIHSDKETIMKEFFCFMEDVGFNSLKNDTEFSVCRFWLNRYAAILMAIVFSTLFLIIFSFIVWYI